MALVDERAEPLRAAALNERIGRYTWVSGREGEAPSLLPASRRARGRAAAERRAGSRPRRTRPDPGAQLAGRGRGEACAGSDRRGAPGGSGHGRSARDDHDGHRPLWPRAMRPQRCRLSRSRRGSSSAPGTTRTSPACRTTGCTTSSPWAASRRPPTPPSQDRAAMREIGLERSLLATSATVNESAVLVDLGRFDHARAILDDAVGLVQPDWWRAWALQARVWLNWVTGDLDGAEGDLAEIRRLAPELTEGQTYGPHARAVAVVALETEHWETAVQTAADAVRQLPRRGRPPGRALGDDDRCMARSVGRRRADAGTGRPGPAVAGSSSRRPRPAARRCGTAAERQAHGQGPSSPRPVPSRTEGASRAPRRARTGTAQSTHSTPLAPSRNAPTRESASPSVCLLRAPAAAT